MKALMNLLQQAQGMQARAAEVQERLAALEVAGEAGGGLVRVVVSGRGDPRRIRIDPSLLRSGEAGILEDLVLKALQDARGKQETEMAAAMQEVTGGLPLPPGFKLF